MKRLLVLVSIVALGSTLAAVQAPAPAQAPAPTPTAAQLEVVKLKDNLFVITSSSPEPRPAFSGGNVSVFITDAGVTLVDTKLAAWGPALLDKVKSITPKPVTTIISTHTHGDHTGNNDKFGKVEVIAQENTKANLAKMPSFQGAGAQFLPSRTYTDKLSIGRGASQIDLHYFGAAHTNGDTVVVFPALRIAQMGDLFAWQDAPLCDRNKRRQLRRVSEDAGRRRGGAEEHRHRDPGSQPDDEGQRRRAVSALHGGPGVVEPGGDEGGQDGGRGVRGVQRGEVPRLPQHARQGGDSDHLRRIEVTILS
jgi:glyoxylase-like metal-dependent hydrolase (beta-lactamase superfamily II)